MKKHLFFSSLFITILTGIYTNIVVALETKYDLKTKSNTFKPGIVTIIVAVFSLAVLSITMESKVLYYFFPILIILSFGIFWKRDSGNTSSNKKSKKEESIRALKKPGFATFKKINEYIIIEKKYLLTGINLNNIAKQFDISSGYLSQLINTHAQKSFNDYINKLRIETSKKMLFDPEYKHYTIESIGIECGFKSKSNFYTTFKKFTGQTPNQYKRQK